MASEMSFCLQDDKSELILYSWQVIASEISQSLGAGWKSRPTWPRCQKLPVQDQVHTNWGLQSLRWVGCETEVSCQHRNSDSNLQTERQMGSPGPTVSSCQWNSRWICYDFCCSTGLPKMDRQLKSSAAYEHACTDEKERSNGRCKETYIEYFLRLAKERTDTNCWSHTSLNTEIIEKAGIFIFPALEWGCFTW